MDKEELQQYRAEQYGRLAAVLERDHEVPGAAAIFNQALSCGLAAIVAHPQTGAELRKNGEVKSARELITALKVQARHGTEDGDVLLLRGAEGGLDVRIHWKTLETAIGRTDGVRHGRGVGELERHYVDVLLELDDHDALLRVLEEQRESDWVKDQIRQRHEYLRASDYLELIGDEEADRRAEAAVGFDTLAPGAVDEGEALEECPVCWRETLAVVGIGSGACFACSYTRSSAEAEEITRGLMMARAMAKD